MRPVHTEPDNNQPQHREHGDIQQCVNHSSTKPFRFGDMIYRRPEKFPARRLRASEHDERHTKAGWSYQLKLDVLPLLSQ
jgi:hypothetical protein